MRFLWFLGTLLLLTSSCLGNILVRGRVFNDRGSPLADVQLSVSAAPAHASVTASTATNGSFQLQLDEPGSYLLNVSKEGFFQIKDYRLAVTEPSLELVLTMNPLREVFQSLNVHGTSSSVDLD